MTRPYSAFAQVYDRFVADGPQAAWLDWLTRHLPLSSMDAADVGCGTGRVTVALAQSCRRVVGVDRSEEMLAEAMARAQRARVRVDWLCQDMRRLRLPYPVDLVVATCDSVNYLLGARDVAHMLARVHAALRPGGWLCFDVLGPKRLQRLTDGVWHDIRDDAAAVFTSRVDAHGRITYDLTLFLAEPDGRYRRVDEVHCQQYHEPRDLAAWLRSCGFTEVQMAGDFGRAPWTEADRVVITARKPVASE
ncbi:methyltransferase [Alicyclobacillus cellulosilyticus]|uniref:Methyltransferase n=1 Tax=Alicyclobacillus cellulosilyticus TaxID=1003997 RepID=A0A917NP00_9BACL|nr:class I SAM-dependent methyltransferase [Alicyclobacillus cellulosilyticus]GGJ12093.1 methyltransferase [Alicyclobacillus cellulosilyticus]